MCTFHAFRIFNLFSMLWSLVFSARVCGVCLADQIELNQNGNVQWRKKKLRILFDDEHAKIKTKLTHENSFPVDRLTNIVRNKRFVMFIFVVSIEMLSIFPDSFLFSVCLWHRLCVYMHKHIAYTRSRVRLLFLMKFSRDVDLRIQEKKLICS